MDKNLTDADYDLAFMICLAKSVYSETGCLLYQGKLASTGYAKVYIQHQQLFAHRVSWIANRGPIPEGLIVCHKCDVRNCIEPTHLFIGTDSDNIQDMISKGRRVWAKGTEVPVAKINDSIVKAIFDMYRNGMSHRKIGRCIGLDHSSVGDVLRRHTWKHVEVAGVPLRELDL